MARRAAESGAQGDADGDTQPHAVAPRGRPRGKQALPKTEKEVTAPKATTTARTTRARTKARTNDRDAEPDNDGNHMEDAGNAKVADTDAPVRKRGRPKGSTNAATAAAKAKTKSTSGTSRADVAVGSKKRVNDGDDAGSSDDEMDVVTVRNGTGPEKSNGARRGRKPGSTTTASTATSTAARGRGRPRAVAEKAHDEEEEDDDDDDELAQLNVSLHSGLKGKKSATTRSTTATTPARAAAPTATTGQRGRPKKTAASTSSVSDKPAPATRQSRTSKATAPAGPAALTQKASSMASKSNPKPKKKVTFLDFTEPSDKENLPTPDASSEKKPAKKTGATSNTGMAAKPSRPAASTTTSSESAGGRKSVSGSSSASGENVTAEAAPAKEPLSPKKPTQVAKSGPSSDNAAESDEQIPNSAGSSGSPSRRMSRSPVKQISSMSASLSSPAKKIDICMSSHVALGPSRTSDEERPPEKKNEEMPPTDADDNESAGAPLKDSVITSSPARRPPPSPFKDMMKKESPRKAPLLITSDTSTTPRKLAKNTESSPLKLSPKKVQIGIGTPGDRSNSPDKQKDKMSGSLLLTPAKRPLLVPTPLSLRAKVPQAGYDMGSPGAKSEVTLPDKSLEPMPEDVLATIDAHHKEEEEGNTELAADDQYPEREESPLEISHLEGQLNEEDICQEVAADSPVKTSLAFQSDGDDPFVISEVNSAQHTPERNCSVVPAESSVGSSRSFIGVPPPAPSPPVFSNVTSPPQRFGYRDEVESIDSDAESCMDVTPTKTERPESPQKKMGAEDEGLFSPLAAKLSKWRATSPEKWQPKRYNLPGPFSPVHPFAGGRRARDSLDSKHSLNVRRQSEKGRASVSSVAGTAIEGVEGTPTLMRLFDRGDEDGVSAALALPQFEDGDGSPLKPSEKCKAHPRSSCVPGDGRSILTADDDESAAHNEPIAHNSDMTDSILLDLGPAEQQEALEGTSGCVDVEDDDEVFADENAAPTSDPTVTLPADFFDHGQNDHTPIQHTSRTSPLPMSVTPVRRDPEQARAAHTVSKVPLRPDDDGGLNVSKKRSRSMSFGGKKDGQVHFTPKKSNRSPPKPLDLKKRPEASYTPNSSARKGAKSVTPRQSPVRSAAAKSTARRKQGGNANILRGAVVYTDVHTSEGSDASGIFVELLSQMGARCVKSWGWNPRTPSLSPPVDGGDGNGEQIGPAESTKVGITHVVYKDGGVRTLEKVREANGVVKCVGVGWVLDCERSNKWLDEAEYAVDISSVPRGGQKRRKSMEPRALGNMNGSIVKLDSSTSSLGGSRRISPDRESQEAAVQELKRLSPGPSSPTSSVSSRRESSPFSSPRRQREERRRTVTLSLHEDHDEPQESGHSSPTPSSPPAEPPATPSFSFAWPDNEDDDDNTTRTGFSPTTPFYLSERARLVQQTCPPRQLRQGLFDTANKSSDVNSDSRGEDGMSAGLRSRLEAAKRRSLVWRPKVGSPLAK